MATRPIRRTGPLGGSGHRLFQTCLSCDGEFKMSDESGEYLVGEHVADDHVRCPHCDDLHHIDGHCVNEFEVKRYNIDPCSTCSAFTELNAEVFKENFSRNADGEIKELDESVPSDDHEVVAAVYDTASELKMMVLHNLRTGRFTASMTHPMDGGRPVFQQTRKDFHRVVTEMSIAFLDQHRETAETGVPA